MYFIILLVYWFVFKYYDPIGLENATKSASSQFFSAITEPFYGYGQGDRTQSHVAVVEISDETLKAEQETWPVSYHREAYWLRHIIEAHPAAVLVDIYFDGERQGDSLHAFDSVLAEAKELGIPIFFVRGMATELAHDLPPVLAPYQVYSGWETEKSNMYPLLVSAPQDKGKKYPTPAFAMYSTLCEGAWKNACKAGEEFEEPLFVRWGVYTDPLQKIAFDGESGECRDSHAGGLARLFRAVNTGAHALSGKWEPPEDNRCFYALTLDAARLDALSPLTKQPYTDMLRNRAVFFGGDLQAIHDVTTAPAIGQVPAVQLHAMAFDNLITYGAGYFHEASRFGEFHIFGHAIELDNAEALELGIWMLLSLVLVRASLSDTQQGAEHSGTPTHDERKAAFPQQPESAQPQTAPSPLSGLKKIRIKYLVAAALAVSGFLYDSFCRGYFSLTVLIFYVLLFLTMICMPVEFETQTYTMKIRQTLCVCSLVYCVNELFLHLPNADWIGLALLWFTVPEVNEENSFVKSTDKFISEKFPCLKKQR
ncbi:CHASE2 domain-containing protein [Acetobacter cerevisiae]|uniref:CHASE2 domain-containing protein n=1 Tax=Acetobacter cerevisiae TaxID=178900 RepID=A0A149Q2X4_9PROT|nr:CHASE2 domain-containing protein [Acetobacter cerevisiae]KXU91649.1 hypothetical protein AD928_12995 [Acetobacter cerevisiae]GBQ06362.1 hypothetical protein AA14362_0830 [Acetobacter cerevisiae DSM 14362]